MKKLITYFSLVLLMLSILIVSSCRPREVKSPIIKESIIEEQEKETPEQVCTTMLEMRNEMIYQDHIDSMYINMPVEAIIVICLNNPEYTVEDVVKEYESKIEYYTELLRQKALIEKYKETIKIKQQFKPDTIPNKPHKDTLVQQLYKCLISCFKSLDTISL